MRMMIQLLPMQSLVTEVRFVIYLFMNVVPVLTQSQVPRIDHYDETQQLHGAFILRLKREWKCEEHRGESGQPGCCYRATGGGQHLGLNNRRLSVWAAAMVCYSFIYLLHHADERYRPLVKQPSTPHPTLKSSMGFAMVTQLLLAPAVGMALAPPILPLHLRQALRPQTPTTFCLHFSHLSFPTKGPPMVHPPHPPHR